MGHVQMSHDESIVFNQAGFKKRFASPVNLAIGLLIALTRFVQDSSCHVHVQSIRRSVAAGLLLSCGWQFDVRSLQPFTIHASIANLLLPDVPGAGFTAPLRSCAPCMCLHVSVAILSGQSVFVEMEPGSSVEDLRKAAESQLQTSLGILVQPGGAEFLRGTSTLQDAGIQDGDVVGAFMAKPKLQLHANRLSHAICAIQKDGSVIAWGDEDSGGDSSDVQDELVNVWDVA